MLNQVEKEETVSIDEEMASDWAAIREKFKEEPEVKAEPEAKAPEAKEAPVEPKVEEPKESKPERTRDATGKFAKEPEPVNPTPSVAETPVPEHSERDINRAPSTWKPAARAEFDKLSPAIKAEIHRREGDFQNGQAQLLPDARFGAEVRKVVEPYRMLIETAGGTPERAISDMLKQAAVLRTGTEQQKYATVAQIARFYGIDLRRFAPQTAAGQTPTPQVPQDFRDPRVDGLLQELQGFNNQRVQQDLTQRETAVNKFMSEVDAQGNPKRPYVGDVINEMTALVPQVKQENPSLTHEQALEAAYERAIWAHPEVRPLLLQKQQTELEAKRLADNQQKVTEAKRAASVNVTRRGSVPSAGKPGSLDQTIAETARALGLTS